MLALKDRKATIEWAKANARRTGTPRYIIMYGSFHHIEKTPPKGIFGSHPYLKVMPDGTVTEHKS